jgi:phytoene dehydrogenase-like protein
MRPDAVVVGSGPNGLAAAITLAAAGRRVLVREAQETIGGGVRSAALTLPGFVHDVCSAVHPLAVASPWFRALPLAARGLEWIHPDVPHPLDGGTAAVLDSPPPCVGLSGALGALPSGAAPVPHVRPTRSTRTSTRSDARSAERFADPARARWSVDRMAADR